jgi:two-component sensor histidine kinase
MNGLTLLLIEDNPGDARLLHEMLREQGNGYRIVWVQTLAEALKEIASRRFHLILCDLNLKDAQGFETASAVIAAALDMPIIIITGQDDDQTALEAIKDGVQDYLVKNTVTPELIGRSIRYAIERKLVEERLKATLAEKEVLLKEVHHRVKNNLQVISSLISLQADSMTDANLHEALDDVRDRIRTMALVHEKLYQTDDLAKLNFAEYANSLLNDLWSSHGAATGNVRLNMSLAPLILPVEMAVPCGLILNELGSNAIKHAFPGGCGEVAVTLEYDAATGAVCLRVRDNGVGLPADLDWRRSASLGLRLVQMLAGQLHGTVQTGPCFDLGSDPNSDSGSDPGPGAEFQVNFNVKGNPS